MLCWVTQSCSSLCNPTDCSPPGSSVHGDSPGKNTGMGCHALLQGIFPTREDQGSNSSLLHCRQILLSPESPGKPYHLCIHSNQSYTLKDSNLGKESKSFHKNFEWYCIMDSFFFSELPCNHQKEFKTNIHEKTLSKESYAKISTKNKTLKQKNKNCYISLMWYLSISLYRHTHTNTHEGVNVNIYVCLCVHLCVK